MSYVSLRHKVTSLRDHVLALRSLVARLPLAEYQQSDRLQAWYDEMKTVMEDTNPDWLAGQPEEDQ